MYSPARISVGSGYLAYRSVGTAKAGSPVRLEYLMTLIRGSTVFERIGIYFSSYTEPYAPGRVGCDALSL